MTAVPSSPCHRAACGPRRFARRPFGPVFGLVAIAAIGAGLLPLAARAADEADFRAINWAAVEGHVIPRYQSLATATAGLERAAERYCAERTPLRLQQLEQRFAMARETWAGIEHIALGPVEDDQRRHRLAFWPDQHGTARKQLRALLDAADPGALATERFAEASVAVQGFGALERVLAAGLTPPEPEQGEYRCGLVQAIAASIAGNAKAVVLAWTEPGDPAGPLGGAPYRVVLSDTGAGNPLYPSQARVAAELLDDLAEGLGRVVRVKIERPLAELPEAAHPQRAEAWRSEQSLALIESNLEGLAHLYRTAFSPLLRADPDAADLDRRLRRDFNAAAVAAASIDQPLSRAISDPARHPQVLALRDQVRGLEQAIADDVAAVLGLRAGLGDMGGD